ncbi:MAG TPA: tripartite tricarboxylate transporter substrate-binding protein, partial [Burkholderiales bacterium]|nr:tripartite tricarboxylate transporter substrate-binding protein [Burkholderiales bacterium]
PTRLAPGLPTVSETVPGYETVSRLAIFAPAGTPPAIVSRLSGEIVAVLNRPDVKEKFHATGVEAVGSTPEALGALVSSEMERMGKVIKAAGIRAD